MHITSFDLNTYRFRDGSIRRYTELGCYPIFYLCADNGVLCPACVQSERPDVPEAEQEPWWKVVAADVNWEDQELTCDHCNGKIESAYGTSADLCQHCSTPLVVDTSRVCDDSECQRFPNRCDHLLVCPKGCHGNISAR